jgi:hypothetical protein
MVDVHLQFVFSSAYSFVDLEMPIDLLLNLNFTWPPRTEDASSTTHPHASLNICTNL